MYSYILHGYDETTMFLLGDFADVRGTGLHFALSHNGLLTVDVKFSEKIRV